MRYPLLALICVHANMRGMKHASLSLLALMVLVSACSGGSRWELRDATPKGSAFQKALSAHYLKVADMEAEKSRHSNADFFAEKGLRSAKGEVVTPEKVLPSVNYNDHKDTLTEGLRTLEPLLITNLPENHPQELAEAQTLYDCWLVRARSLAPNMDTALCKEKFFNRIQWLRDALQKDPATVPAGGIKVSDSYMIYFDWDRAQLNNQALTNLRQMSEEIIKEHKGDALAVNGHADSSGAAEYNMALSQRRAETVKGLLASYGVPKERMTVFAFGESDLAVPTGDNVREPKNRRVEVFAE
jgi:outer membrane protein OmpA-like peptidoglycan-associated protein